MKNFRKTFNKRLGTFGNRMHLKNRCSCTIKKKYMENIQPFIKNKKKADLQFCVLIHRSFPFMNEGRFR